MNGIKNIRKSGDSIYGEILPATGCAYNHKLSLEASGVEKWRDLQRTLSEL